MKPVKLLQSAREDIRREKSYYRTIDPALARTLQDWEQGRRQRSRAAASLVQIAKQRPDVLSEVFG